MIRYEYVGPRNRREMTDWPKLSPRDRRGLNFQLDILRQVDRRQALRRVVFKVKGSGLYKIKAKGDKQLRPRLCFGPLDSDDEETVTFLQRVEKKDNREAPAAIQSAKLSHEKIRQVVADPRRRRAEIKKKQEGQDGRNKSQASRGVPRQRGAH
ncbi:MAG: hypothetical protein GY719_37555 [bacterium]|nr:hypothetical protein [bacterium]